MHLLNSVGVFACAIIVKGEYFLSKTSTSWYNVQCSMAEPELEFKNGHFELRESINLLPRNPEAWVGYISTKVPFLFLGCAKLSSSHIFTVQSIGYCHNVCGGGMFGIKSSVQFECRCASQSVAILLQQCFGNICSDCWSIYTKTTATAYDRLVRRNLSAVDCLTYNHPTFHWSLCEGSVRKVMCSNKTYTDLTAKAKVIDQSENTWRTGIAHCLEYNMYPASQHSIIIGGFGNVQSQPYWTGVIRAHTLVRRSTKDNVTSTPEEGYAWINDTDQTIYLSFFGVKQSICFKANATPLSTTTIFQTQYSTHSTYANHVEDQSSTNVDPNSVGVGVGVSVAVLFTVGGAVIIIAIKRRGNLNCWKKHYNAQNIPNGSTDVFCVNPTTGKVADGIDNHNYFVLEKCTISDADNSINLTSISTENDDNYNSINEIDEPYARVEDDNYDYTTNTSEALRTTMTPSNVYIKLGNALPMYTNHAGRNMHGISQNMAQEPDNDYNITPIVMSIQAKMAHVDECDYDHIRHPIIATQNKTTKRMGENTNE
ncbi:uncharacterized protein LOC127860952 isoform X2 [Dreissena polymorpha]|uniref:uncharacterized protein LOC127860952 isoform X2 n=1 Tax=Dreissena polymorpha TaxID=45954 RepID=UPI002264FACC|nr:uncharacterized protein LOC127860952 isoform X2 [Dreissena polymorpha]